MESSESLVEPVMPDNGSIGIIGVDVDEPRLPPEIEEQIFLLAFRNTEIGLRMNLLLISKRVYSWLQPILYESLVLNDTSIPKPPLSRIAEFGGYVRNIQLKPFGDVSGHSEGGVRVLEWCPNVQNLSIWCTPQTVTVKEVLGLKRLRKVLFHSPGDLEAELRWWWKWVVRESESERGDGGDEEVEVEVEAELQLQLPELSNMETEKKKKKEGKAKTSRHQMKLWCQNITHLGWGSISSTSCELLTLFPNLTHFMLGDWNEEYVVHKILELCPRLRVVIWLLAGFASSSVTSVVEDEEPREGDGRGRDGRKRLSVDDVRVVVVEGELIKDWVRGCKGEDDMWMIAEKKVEERRKLSSKALSG